MDCELEQELEEGGRKQFKVFVCIHGIDSVCGLEALVVGDSCRGTLVQLAGDFLDIPESFLCRRQRVLRAVLRKVARLSLLLKYHFL